MSGYPYLDPTPPTEKELAFGAKCMSRWKAERNRPTISGDISWWERRLGEQQHYVVQLHEDGTYNLMIDGQDVAAVGMSREFWLQGHETFRSRLVNAWRVLRGKTSG